MDNRTLPQMISDEVAILELFNSLAAPFVDYAEQAVITHNFPRRPAA
jgi:hypothetical protein